MNSLFQEDINDVLSASFIPWERLRGKTVFITGGTGLIGYTLISALVRANQAMSLNCSVIALVRNLARARERFSEILSADCLRFVIGSVENFNPESIDFSPDFIIHGASQTSSRGFVKSPVETIDTAVAGTKNMLEFARQQDVGGFVYLSSMEVYGYPERGHKVTEDEIGAFSPLNPRNSYPISKILCEAMCCAYAKEYDVPAKIVRLTQTFGPGVNYNDGRIFAYFARCVIEKKNIVLKTRGETERSYLYTVDAVTAILTILLKGEKGAVYNAADESTYCSIAEMAEKVAADGGIAVEYEIQPTAENGYPDTLYMDLDTTALKSLGWKPVGGGTLVLLYQRMIENLKFVLRKI